MCLHPRLDVNLDRNDSQTDWDIDDNCDYIYNIDHVKNDDFVIIQTNVRGILSKQSLLIDLLEGSVKNRPPDVVLISETWLTPMSPALVIPGYDFVHRCRQDKKGGGVGILISNKLRYTEFTDLSSNMKENETVSVEIILKSGKRCIVSSMYRAPNTTPSAFQGCYESIIFAMKKKNPHSIIVGLDHNLDFLKSTKHSGTTDFIHSNLDMGMFPTITKPTRITKSSATLIDNIIISENLCGSYHSNVLINDMSDHMPTICILNSLKTTKKEPTIITSRDTRPRNIKALKERLNAYDWPLMLNSTSLDANVETLSNVLRLETETCTPVTTRKIHGNKLRREPWLTAQLQHSIDKSKKLYRESLRKNSNTPEVMRYTNYKKTLRSAIRTAKRLYHNNKCEEYRNNSKKLWQLINEVIGKSSDKSSTIDYLTISGIKEYGATKITNTLAKYFSNVGHQYASKIPNPRQSVDNYLRLLQRNGKSLYLNPCDKVEVGKLIRKLPNKNSHGYDNISNIMLKCVADEIVTPLCIIINQSLEKGQFPSEMKLADVVPLFKSKDRSLESNYRPISLLSTMSKILEKIVYNRVYNFLDQTGQISNTQYGFRAKHSCEHAVGQLIGTVLKNIENKKITVAVLLDLSKAFDTIKHEIMLRKLELYGVRGIPLQWFQSYLSERKLRVKCRTTCSNEETYSDQYSIEYGTPQGSCLGPLIFLIFVNDMSLHLSDGDIIQFADDTTLIFGHRNKNYLKFCIERELAILQDWFYANKLTLNVDKSVYLLFERNNTKCDLNISVCGKVLPRCSDAKFLGTWIDDALNWRAHIRKLKAKLKSGLGMMRRANKYLSSAAKRTLYYGQVHSNLSYGVSVWGTMINKGQVRELSDIQRKCVKLIYNKNGCDYFKMARIPTLEQLIVLEQCKMGFKLCTNQLPKGLSKLLTTNHDKQSIEKVHSYPTRSKNIPNRPAATTTLYRNSFLYKSIQHYSSLPYDVRNSTSLPVFVRKCKKELKIGI